MVGPSQDYVRPAVAELDVGALDGEPAADLVELCVEVERLVAATRVMATRAAQDSDRWRREGFRSAAAWMASKAGLPVGPAIAAVEMVRLLDSLAITRAAFRAGRLSVAQAGEIPRRTRHLGMDPTRTRQRPTPHPTLRSGTRLAASDRSRPEQPGPRP